MALLSNYSLCCTFLVVFLASTTRVYNLYSWYNLYLTFLVVLFSCWPSYSKLAITKWSLVYTIQQSQMKEPVVDGDYITATVVSFHSTPGTQISHSRPYCVDPHRSGLKPHFSIWRGHRSKILKCIMGHAVTRSVLTIFLTKVNDAAMRIANICIMIKPPVLA